MTWPAKASGQRICTLIFRKESEGLAEARSRRTGGLRWAFFSPTSAAELLQWQGVRPAVAVAAWQRQGEYDGIRRGNSGKLQKWRSRWRLSRKSNGDGGRRK
ncbi:uncharacterized protein LOC131014386 [Salvia miltiorrhiza]|uniref:uncharacterized protein LOC131014386 n=1 Tax=Salvia miltiorrhiza TaxID=226208 RepID=UPI0025AC21B5|nr:uncharacterized protein LOC131014386 [Salvia miltiorrhiza]